MNQPEPSSRLQARRRVILDELEAIATMRPGTLAEEYIERRADDGVTRRLGPYYKHQVWLEGRNVTRRVPPSQAALLREDIDNAKRFHQLTAELARINTDHTMELRSSGESAGEDSKKNSGRHASRKGTARRKHSSRESARISAQGAGSITAELECGLREAMMADGRRMVEELLNDRTLVPDDPKPGVMESVHRGRVRKVHTLFGDIRLKRCYLHHIPSGSGHHPLDVALDLEHGYTPALARIVCRAATQGASHKAAAADLAEYAGIELDSRGFPRLIAAVAPLLREGLAILPVAVPAQGVIPVMYVSSDGTGVPMRREELQGVKGKQEDGSARTREAKLCCVFTQTSTDDEGMPIRDPDSTSYVGTFQGCREAGIALRGEAMRRGLPHAKQVVYIGDGAAWVWENARANFPGAAQILDFYHGSEHVVSLAAALWTEHPAEAARTGREWCDQMKVADNTVVIAGAEARLASGCPIGDTQREVAAREINYLKTHAERMRYGVFRAKGWFIGSGVMEAGCKAVVGRRLKQSGMFWSERGAEDLLSLRCLTIGTQFDAAWQARRSILAKQRLKKRRWLAKSN